MRERYDVAIVGAGPAGAVLARELAVFDPGLSVIVINGQDEERRKPCGGLLAPDAQKLLAKLDLTLSKNILADPQIFAVETIDLPRRQVRYYQRHYLNMDRYAFDSWLLSLVPGQVDVVAGRCASVWAEEEGYGLSLQCGGETCRVSAGILVGADGGGSIVRRTFFDRPLLQYVAIQQWFENSGQQLPYYSCIFDPKTSDSCSWTIHKDQWVIFGGAFRKEGCRQAFEEQKARFEEFVGSEFGRALKTEACLVSSPRRMKDFVLGQGGVFLVGEAAGFISSSSFEGISSAILSGRLLAEALSQGEDHREILRLYRRKTLKLQMKLCFKNPKRWVICSPFLRNLVMKSGIQSVARYE